MCYSGKCLFENTMGDCSIFSISYKEFEDIYGYTPCAVGGFDYYMHAGDPDYKEFYKQHAAEFKRIYKDYRQK